MMNQSTLTSDKLFTIGALAKQAAVAVDTIRYYEREGLLSNPERKASGYRQYDAKALERVMFIRRAKDLGFTLEEIKSLLMLSTDRENGVEGVKKRAQDRLNELDRRLREMKRMRDDLALLLDACPGCGEPECCPILSTLHGDETVVASPSSPDPSGGGESCCCGGADPKPNM